MKQVFYICLFLLLICNQRSFSQVFADPTNPNGPPQYFTVYEGSNGYEYNLALPRPGAGATKTIRFTAKLFRPAGVTGNGYIEIFTGSNLNNLNTPALAGSRTTIQPTQWLRISNTNYESTTAFSSDFTITEAQANNATGLFAVYYATAPTPPFAATKGAVSQPVLLGPATAISQPTPTGSPSPTVIIGPSYASLYPCGTSTVICDDQCVLYGTLPSIIKGRELASTTADWGATYISFILQADYSRCFANAYNERETVDWQYSYSNNWDDWHDIYNNGHGRDFQPWVCDRTTYYRRKSIHMFVNMWGQAYHEEWYISNTVTITPRSVPPTPVQPTVTTCTQATAVALAVNPVAPAISYNWWVPYAGWGISNDGLSPFSTFNQNTSFVTTCTNVVITFPPGGVAPGTYPIAVSTTGACGGQTADAIINIVVNSGGTAPVISGATFVKAASSTLCFPKYNWRTPVVSGATSYQATDNNGTSVTGSIVSSPTSGSYVLFELLEEGPQTATVTIEALGTCGTSSYTTPPTNLAGPPSKCNSLKQLPQASYPNPATEQVTITTGGQKAQATFYDAAGTARKTVQLSDESDRTEVNVRDLPTGLYHLRISVDGQPPINEQIVIKP